MPKRKYIQTLGTEIYAELNPIAEKKGISLQMLIPAVITLQLDTCSGKENLLDNPTEPGNQSPLGQRVLSQKTLAAVHDAGALYSQLLRLIFRAGRMIIGQRKPIVQVP